MGACERCDGGGTCLQATCNFECKKIGDACETIVMGGFGDPPPEGLSKAVRDSAARFSQTFRIEQCTELMTDAGLVVGEEVTHVNGQFPRGLDEFAEMVKDLSKGTVLKVWRKGQRLDVTL